MSIDWIYEIVQNTRPNTLTTGMGELIRQAREEQELSQEALAQKIYRRRPSLSAMENGKMEPDASTLLSLASVLRKPLIYFYPPKYAVRIPHQEDELHPLEQELIMAFRKLPEEAQRVAIKQVRALRDLEEWR